MGPHSQEVRIIRNWVPVFRMPHGGAWRRGYRTEDEDQQEKAVWWASHTLITCFQSPLTKSVASLEEKIWFSLIGTVEVGCSRDEGERRNRSRHTGPEEVTPLRLVLRGRALVQILTLKGPRTCGSGPPGVIRLSSEGHQTFCVVPCHRLSEQ